MEKDDISLELLNKLYKMLLDKHNDAKNASSPDDAIILNSQAAGIAFTLWNEVGYLYSDLLAKVSILQNPQQLQNQKKPNISPMEAFAEMVTNGKNKKTN